MKLAGNAEMATAATEGRGTKIMITQMNGHTVGFTSSGDKYYPVLLTIDGMQIDKYDNFDIAKEKADKITKEFPAVGGFVLTLNIKGDEKMVVMLDIQKLTVAQKQNVGGIGSNTRWSECNAVIEHVPVGAVLSIYNPTGVLRFKLAEGDGHLTIDGSLKKTDGL